MSCGQVCLPDMLNGVQEYEDIRSAFTCLRIYAISKRNGIIAVIVLLLSLGPVVVDLVSLAFMALYNDNPFICV